MRRTLQNFEIS